jgi:GT2 family glycosyltransferase
MHEVGRVRNGDAVWAIPQRRAQTRDSSRHASMTNRYVSIVVPMRNEADHIDRLVDEIAAQDFEGEFETLVADGGSDDRSVERLTVAADHAGLEVTVLHDHTQRISAGLNACIRRARGDLIIRLDCHTSYPRDYVRLLVAAAEETGAWNVGGLVVPRGGTTTQRAVACAMDSPFGGIGWTREAAAGGRTEVDTVPFGAFRREAFQRVGLYDEALVCDEDEELNLRIRRAGGTIVLEPAVSVAYMPRSSYAAVARQYYSYGLWKVPVMRKHRRVLTIRSLAPLAFVSSLAALALAAIALPAARVVLGAEVALYTALAVAFAAVSAAARDEPLGMIARIALAYPAFHLSYGAGMAHGLVRAVGRDAPGTMDGGSAETGASGT